MDVALPQDSRYFSLLSGLLHITVIDIPHYYLYVHITIIYLSMYITIIRLCTLLSFIYVHLYQYYPSLMNITIHY